MTHRNSSNRSIRIFTLALASVLVALLAVGCASNRTAGERLDDSTITTKVKAKLTADPQVNPFEIDVDTENGVVRLSGVVENADARSEAVKLAADTRGVVRVIDELEAGDQSFGEKVDDATITTKIEAKLAADPEINPFEIDVDTVRGVVTLSGTVHEAAQRAEAERIALETKGVRDVRNRIELERGS